MLQKLKDKILEYVEYDGEITEETEIVKDLRMSSLDIMMMLGDLENEYNITFAPEDIENVITVGDFVKLMLKKIK